MAVSRIRKVETKKQMDNLIDDYVTQGYAISSQGENSALLYKKTGNKVLVHVLLALFFWWCAFIPNIIYFFMGKKEEIMVKVEKE